MTNKGQMTQHPVPGISIQLFRGDLLVFTLTVPDAQSGKAWLRTNIGNSQIRNREIIRAVDQEAPVKGADWHDIAMKRIDGTRFQITLPICDTGRFLAKCYFRSYANPHLVMWPPGEFTQIHVWPSDYKSFSPIYRPQPDSEAWTTAPQPDADNIRFHDIIRHLDHLIDYMGFRIIQLPAFQILPFVDTFAIHGIGEGCPSICETIGNGATADQGEPTGLLEPFLNLIHEVHRRHGKVFLEISIDQIVKTYWRLHKTAMDSHPFLESDDRQALETMGKDGTKWAINLGKHIAGILLTWCRLGVDGFVCHQRQHHWETIWQYIQAVVRDQFHDCVFISEAPERSPTAIQQMDTQDPFDASVHKLTMLSVPEIHDENQWIYSISLPIQVPTIESPVINHIISNAILHWTSSGLRMTSVHASLDSIVGHKGDLPLELIRRFNLFSRIHETFHEHVRIKRLYTEVANCFISTRYHPGSGTRLLTIANLDTQRGCAAWWAPEEFPNIDPDEIMDDTLCVYDILSQAEVHLFQSNGRLGCLLEPGQLCCLCVEKPNMDLASGDHHGAAPIPEPVVIQRFRSKALDVYRYYRGYKDLGDFDTHQAAMHLAIDPVEYCRTLNPNGDEPRVTRWHWDKDCQREVMIPPEHFFLVKAHTPFRATLLNKGRVLAQEECLPCTDGAFVALFSPLTVPKVQTALTLRLSIYSTSRFHRYHSPVLLLPKAEDTGIKTEFYRSNIIENQLIFLATSQNGSVLQMDASWPFQWNQYHGWLGVKLNPELPVHQWQLLARCRIWIEIDGITQELTSRFLYNFRLDTDLGGHWKYCIPCGQGSHVWIHITLRMVQGADAVTMQIFRGPGSDEDNLLADDTPVRILVRPDIEDRASDETTLARLGPAWIWPAFVDILPNGFLFHPGTSRFLLVRMSNATFEWDPKWDYGVVKHLENPESSELTQSDLFSPGFFQVELYGNRHTTFIAQRLWSRDDIALPLKMEPQYLPEHMVAGNPGWKLNQTLKRTLGHFMVKTSKTRFILTGYPWILDRGRDSLIFTRGLIADGRINEAREILLQFAEYEMDGTLPSTIHGMETGSRDYADLGLWLVIACQDLLDAEGNDSFLYSECRGRTIKEILFSVVSSMMIGTPNGIRMDPESSLLFCPDGFSWMTAPVLPMESRQGYPIEIQALWYAALMVLSRIDRAEPGVIFKSIASQVRASVMDLFFNEERGWLSDCLHCQPGDPASMANADEALRPNQVLAISLGLIEEQRICRQILEACEELLVPGAIRSLADRPVTKPRPSEFSDTADPELFHPYIGRGAEEDQSQRIMAQFNGAAWTWLLPSYCEAWANVHGEAGRQTALAWLSSGTRLLGSGCVGHVPEWVDGSFPHTPRGCDASALGVSELLRVWYKLNKKVANSVPV